MDAAQTIRQSLYHVSALREQANSDPELERALKAVKHFQARRFAGTYRDLLESETFAAPTRFFLNELYGERDFSERDAQFARIAGALQTFFPAQVVETATALADLHALTESLDLEMARQYRSDQQTEERGGEELSPNQYVLAWRATSSPKVRQQQLNAVLQVGAELTRLTHTKGLRMSLRLMRGPAKAAGLSALQYFLESGFDTFATMGRQAAPQFLELIQERESMWVLTLFNAPAGQATAQLSQCLGG